MTAQTMKKDECDKKHENIDAKYEALHKDVRRLVTAVCGDLEDSNPGILGRLRALELRYTIMLGVATSGIFLAIVGAVVKYVFLS